MVADDGWWMIRGAVIRLGHLSDTAVQTKPKTAKQRRAEAKRVRDEEKRQQLKETKRKKNELSQ